MYAIHLSSNKQPCISELRSHNTTPLNISIHIASPSHWIAGIDGRSSGGAWRRAVRFESVTIIGLQPLSRPLFISESKINGNHTRLQRRVLLFLQLQLRKMLLKIYDLVYDHYIQLPPNVLVGRSQYSLSNKHHIKTTTLSMKGTDMHTLSLHLSKKQLPHPVNWERKLHPGLSRKL